MPSKVKTELSLVHDGKVWIASNDFITAKGKELIDLDKEVEKQIIASGKFEQGCSLKVKMNFDNRTIPEWFRQYSNHYFNRILKIQL